MAPLVDESIGPKRQSTLILDTRVSLSDLPSNLSTQKLGTELASNSQVDDLGNGKHLEQQRDSEDLVTGATASSQQPAEILFANTGTGFRLEGDSHPISGNLDVPTESQTSSLGRSDSLLEGALPETQVTAPSEYTGSLGDDLRGALCDTEGKQHNEFLPIDSLDRIVTECRVREEIAKFSKGPNDGLDLDVQDILGASTSSRQKTSRKKIFAMLALVDKLEAISDFVTEGIYDIHLPFEKGRAQSPSGARIGRPELSRRSGTDVSTRIPIKAFQSWSGAEVTNFERTQWNVHIPIFFLNTPKEPKVRHYPLQESVVLPFIEDDEIKQNSKMGGFADVWRVKFHPSHHNQGFLASGRRENPSFAIKRLRYMDEKAFRNEVQNLKRFSTRDYLNLIKLLATYEWRHQYYLVFPWADGNLLDFWERHPEPLAPRRDINIVLWFSEQCLGLVEGMKMIHTWDKPDVGGQHDPFSFETHQTHGVHGDLKPENILWFKQYEHKTEKYSSSMGHFKISDFGLTHFHGKTSVGHIDAKETGFSPTYRAPERDVKREVTQSYDVWSLACVLLEFASWYLGGFEEVKAFGQNRVREDTQFDGGYKQDRFFNCTRTTEEASDEVHARAQTLAVEKVSVVQEFERLYDNPHCSDYLLDFLEIVQKNLLRLGPEKRSDCCEIAKSLQKLHDNLQKDSSYGINRVKQPPSRSPTLDSILMEGEPSPEFRKQIRNVLPRRSISFDRETAHNSTSIPAVLSSSPSSSLINLVPGPRRDSRPSSPERKAAFRTSRDLSTVQELPRSEANDELDKEQQSHLDGEAAASQGTAGTDNGHASYIEHVTGLNFLCDGLTAEQQMGTSDAENTQQTPVIDNAAAEAPLADRGPDPGFNIHGVSDKSSPSEPGSTTGTEELSQGGHDEDSQPTTNVTAVPKADVVSQSAHLTSGNEDESHNSTSGVSRGVDIIEHLEVPLDGGEERPSSESPTLFQNSSDTGRDDVPARRTRNSSRTGSQGREKMPKHADTAESIVEDEGASTRSGRFKSILKKIPCFNCVA